MQPAKSTKDLIADANRLSALSEELNNEYIRAKSGSKEELHARLVWLQCKGEHSRAHARALTAICADAGLKDL